MQYVLQGLVTITGVFVAFWIKDVFWENRKRKADFDQKRLSECLCPLHAELLALPDLLSSTFVRDRILPIVEKSGYLLSNQAYEAFAELCLAEAEFRRVHSQMEEIGRVDKTTVERLIAIITVGMPLDEMVKHLSDQDIAAIESSMEVNILTPVEIGHSTIAV